MGIDPSWLMSCLRHIEMARTTAIRARATQWLWHRLAWHRTELRSYSLIYCTHFLNSLTAFWRCVWVRCMSAVSDSLAALVTFFLECETPKMVMGSLWRQGVELTVTCMPFLNLRCNKIYDTNDEPKWTAAITLARTSQPHT